MGEIETSILSLIKMVYPILYLLRKPTRTIPTLALMDYPSPTSLITLYLCASFIVRLNKLITSYSGGDYNLTFSICKLLTLLYCEDTKTLPEFWDVGSEWRTRYNPAKPAKINYGVNSFMYNCVWRDKQLGHIHLVK